MATKTFSGRTDENKLQYADLICNQEAGVSFGQFCAGALADYIYKTGELPALRTSSQPNAAIIKMQNLIVKCALRKRSSFGALVADMDDSTLSDLAESRFDE